MMQFPAGELAGVTLAVLDHPLRVAAGDAVRVRVSIANHSRATMGEFRFFTPHQMFLGGVWSDPNNKGLTPDSSLTLLWRPIRPGEHLLMHARVVAPRVPGRYKLWIMLVQNGVRWYDSNTEVKPVALDVEVCETLPVLPHSINDYEDCVYSQNGEDGIVRVLFLRLGYSDPYAVEFGVGDGMECIAAYWMRQYGWRGLLIEGNPDDFARARNNYREFPGVTVAQAYVTLENILELFRRYKVPTEFDLLSIDVDGNDYWLWEALAEYRPRVVVIENNRTFVPPQLWVMAYDPNHVWSPNANRAYHGASLESLARLGNRLGYALLGTDDEDVNAFFVRRDLLERSRFPELTAAQAHHSDLSSYPRGYDLSVTGPYVEQ